MLHVVASLAVATVRLQSGHMLDVKERETPVVFPVLHRTPSLHTAAPAKVPGCTTCTPYTNHLFAASAPGFTYEVLAGMFCSKDPLQQTIPSVTWTRCAGGVLHSSADADTADAIPAASCTGGAVCYTPLGDMTYVKWVSTPKPGCPFPISKDILGWEYLNGSNANYGGADTFYPTWAEDGNIYTPWTDGTLNNVASHSGAANRAPWTSTTGMATVSGDDPFTLDVDKVHTFAAGTWPYLGRYPCGSLSYNSTWYYGTYYLQNPNTTMPFPDGATKPVGPNPGPNCGNWCVQGPLADFRHSGDDGETWVEPLPNSTGLHDNLFNETAFYGSTLKFGAPHFIDFGRNMEHSPDGYAYIVGHGSSDRNNVHGWMLGDEVYMARVLPSKEHINNAASWQFWNNASWVSGVQNAQPVVRWDRNMGVVTASYHPAIKKFILCISTATTYPVLTKEFDTYFLESDSLTSGWALFNYNSKFGPEAYFVNYPSKFMAAEVDAEGNYHSMLSYSANFAMDRNGTGGVPIGSGYHWSLQQSRMPLSKAFAARLHAQ